jgi:glycerol-3-phosphate dehydrogenase
VRAQAAWAREHEFALRDEDVVRRRTTAWLAGSLGSDHGSKVDAAHPAARS